METGFPMELDAFSRQYLTMAAARLEATVPCVPCSEDDYLQDLQLNLWQRQPKFDPSKARWTTFVRLITDHRAIELRNRCRIGRCKARASVELLGQPNDVRDLSPDAHERITITMDIDAWVKSLDPDDQKLCRLLMRETVAETARLLDSPRSTVVDKIRQLRRRYEHNSLREFAPHAKKLRHTPARHR